MSQYYSGEDWERAGYESEAEARYYRAAAAEGELDTLRDRAEELRRQEQGTVLGAFFADIYSAMGIGGLVKEQRDEEVDQLRRDVFGSP